MLENLKQIIERNFCFLPNRNQLQDIERLIFEIMHKESVSLDEIIGYLRTNANTAKFPGRNKFFALKNELIKRRFELTSQREKIETGKVYLPKITKPLPDNWQVKQEFRPLKIFVEKKVNGCALINKLKEKFPETGIEELGYYYEYIKKNKFILSELKKPLIFVVNENWDFVKPCPCTKGHIGCGYWIFNLGFGCPFDCSYCYLQHYTNFPGIILAGNIEDFFDKFDSFYKNLTRPIRIGTGEFCDSLALDEITGYSKILIPYFKNKNVLLELKTKSDKIKNLLDMEPAENIIISWSLNPKSIVVKEEQGAPSLEKRLQAARSIQQKGYKLAFHFDPIIYSENWKQLYKEVVDSLYTMLKAPFNWISLGTLRSHRELKTVSERRFPQSKIFYGELLLGEDKKLRYPQFLREEIYKNMLVWIRNYDSKTPVYLCMENQKMWQSINPGFDSTAKVEKYLLQAHT